VSTPDFGGGEPEKRATRRLTLAIGGFVVALIVALVVYAVVS
jgi:hypothetical protein